MAETPAQRRDRHENEAVALEEELATIATSRLDLDVRNAGTSIIAEFLKGRTGKSLAKLVKRQFKAVRPRIKFELSTRLDRAVALGVRHGGDLVPGLAVPVTGFSDPSLNLALGQLDPTARGHLEAAIDLAAALPLDDRASVVSVLARAHQSVTAADAGARWVAERAVSAGTAAAAKAVGANLLWVAERNGCLHCLAYAGQIVAPGQEFPHDLTFGDKPLTPYEELWFPPLHPNCRCQVELTYEPVGEDESLVREAQRSVARGLALASEPAQRRAADRLLSGPTLLPKTVVARAKRNFDLNSPVPPLNPKAPAAPKVTDFSTLPTGTDLAQNLTELEYPQFPESAVDAVVHYQASGYDPINLFLRKGIKEEGNEDEDVAELDALFDMAPRMPVDGKVYRGMKTDMFAGKDMTGQVIRDLAYMSTSMKPSVAEEFSTKSGSDGESIIFEILVPSGAKFLPLQYTSDNLLNEDNSPPTMKSLMFYEAEILLPHGTQLRIVSDDTTGTGRLIRAEVLP